MTGPFQAVLRKPTRLPWQARLASLAAAVLLSAILVTAVFVAWTLWLGLWRTRGSDDPIPVWIGPEERAGEGLAPGGP